MFSEKCCQMKNLLIREGTRRITICMCVGICIFVLAQICLNYVLPHAGNGLLNRYPSERFRSRKVLCAGIDVLSNKATELEKQLIEMERIKIAGLNDLTEIEAKRYKLSEEMKKLSDKRNQVMENWKSLQKDMAKAKSELRRIKYSEMASRRQKFVPVGLPIRFSGEKAKTKKFERMETGSCTLEDCFDFSRCPVTSPFSAYIYNPMNYATQSLFTTSSSYLYEKFLELPFYSTDFSTSCVAVAIFDITFAIRQPHKAHIIEDTLQNLKYWEKNGQNHVLFFIHDDNEPVVCDIYDKLDTRMAVAVYDSFCKSVFKDNFDVIMPGIPNHFLDRHHLKWKLLPPLFPLKRKYLFNVILDTSFNHSLTSHVHKGDLRALGKTDKTFVQLQCDQRSAIELERHKFVDCRDMGGIGHVFKNSLFTLLFLDLVDEVSQYFYMYFFEALRSGSVPVLIGKRLPLPFHGLITWESVSVIVPLSRLPELSYILYTISEENLFEMKKQGRFIWETYFSSTVSVIETVFAVLRSRIKLPPHPYNDFHGLPIEDAYKVSLNKSLDSIPSKFFAHNWTFLSTNMRKTWNAHPGALRMMPSSPYIPPLPSSFQFTGNSEYAPVGDGNGGDGEAFSKALGGDFPMEHFTIVLLTFDRELILLESLQRLVGLKYLNRVIVVWNNPKMPSPELKWPDIGVNVHVVRPGTNSLNNRFLPYDLIDTDAILSMDDDIYLRHDEIELAFRVWRENRDRIVGFPGRFHSWENINGGWYYNANYSCELSMVLTGGAFFHKFYSYLYTYTVSSYVRETVDKLMNCEDIAMNFLVAHVTGKQPIKVTSRWTFRCPGCPNSLSSDDSHFTERGKCIQIFEEVFGYVPLRRTQFRADSVLFKTRLPPGKAKCYRFV